MNVSINERWEKFVEESVRSGRYGSASEVVVEGLRLIEEREKKITILRHELATAIAEGGAVGDEGLEDALREEAALLRLQGY